MTDHTTALNEAHAAMDAADAAYDAAMDATDAAYDAAAHATYRAAYAAAVDAYHAAVKVADDAADTGNIAGAFDITVTEGTDR